MTPEQEKRAEIAVKTLMAIVMDLVQSTKNPFGMPGGELYALVMPTGIPYHTFEAMMHALVMTGQLEKKHQCYKPGPNFPKRTVDIVAKEVFG